MKTKLSSKEIILIGGYLRKVRRLLSLRLEDVAAKMTPAIDSTYLSRIERGECAADLELLLRVSQALGIPDVDIHQLLERRKQNTVTSLDSAELGQMIYALRELGLEASTVQQPELNELPKSADINALRESVDRLTGVIRQGIEVLAQSLDAARRESYTFGVRGVPIGNAEPNLLTVTSSHSEITIDSLITSPWRDEPSSEFGRLSELLGEGKLCASKQREKVFSKSH